MVTRFSIYFYAMIVFLHNEEELSIVNFFNAKAYFLKFDNNSLFCYLFSLYECSIFNFNCGCKIHL